MTHPLADIELYEVESLSVISASKERSGRLDRVARALYEEDAAGVIGARGWSDVPAVARTRWIVLANAYEVGRRLYEESSWGSRDDATPWDELEPERRYVWMMEAVTHPGGAW